VERTKTLVDNLLLLARCDAGRSGTEFHKIDLRGLLRDIADQATRLAAGKEIEVAYCPPDDALNVNADESSLHRLLLALVDNAIKYTPACGSIKIEARHSGGEVSVAVSDTGPGIAAEDVGHVFERFWRADKVRSREAGGAGLGLTIAKQIAEQHGATLTEQSEAGAGAVFTLRLPEAAA